MECIVFDTARPDHHALHEVRYDVASADDTANKVNEYKWIVISKRYKKWMPNNLILITVQTNRSDEQTIWWSFASDWQWADHNACWSGGAVLKTLG